MGSGIGHLLCYRPVLSQVAVPATLTEEDGEHLAVASKEAS